MHLYSWTLTLTAHSYYVCFSTATIVASLILFQGIGTESGVNAVSLLAGFVVIFLGVYLLSALALGSRHCRI